MSSVTSGLLQVVLITVAILISSFIVNGYPEPKPPDPELLPMHTIVVETWNNEKNLGEPFETTAASSISVVFYPWDESGVTDKISVTGISNGTGLVTVIVEEGTYDLKIGEWTTETVEIFENFTIVVHHFDLETLPDVIEINALSQDWQATADDIVSITYTSSFDFIVNLDSVKMSGLDMDNVFCGLADLSEGEQAAVPVGAIDDLYASDSGCDDEVSIVPSETWFDDFIVPVGVSIPWSIVKSNPEITLRISYTELSIDE